MTPEPSFPLIRESIECKGDRSASPGPERRPGCSTPQRPDGLGSFGQLFNCYRTATDRGALDDLINQAIIHCILGAHEEVTFGVFRNFF